MTVPWPDIQPKWDEVQNRVAQEIEIPGFRKGQAPLEMVEPKVDSQVQQEVLQAIMPQALMEALTGTGIIPIDYPQYQVLSFTKGGELKFSTKLAARPTIQLGDYKAVKVKRPTVKQVSDEEVTKIVADLFKRWKLKNPASPVGGPGQASVASGTQPPGTNQTGGSLNFSQPLSQAQAINSQAASPATSSEPDDVFARAVGADSLSDLKAKIRADLEAEARYNNELDWEETILEEIEKITRVDLPDILIEDELNRMLLSLQRSVTDRGLLFDEYLKGQKKTVEHLKQERRPQAERNVRMELGLSEIARKENMVVSDEELQAEIDKIQDQRVKAQFTQEESKLHLRHALRQIKTLNFLKTRVG